MHEVKESVEQNINSSGPKPVESLVERRMLGCRYLYWIASIHSMQKRMQEFAKLRDGVSWPLLQHAWSLF
jgi:hypothetical protein